MNYHQFGFSRFGGSILVLLIDFEIVNEIIRKWVNVSFNFDGYRE